VGACARAVGASIAGAIGDEESAVVGTCAVVGPCAVVGAGAIGDEEGGGGGGGGGGAMKPMTATDDGQ